MPIPDGTRRALARRLDVRRQQRWPELLAINIRYRSPFAYVEGATAHDESLPLLRLRYVGSHDEWGFAIYLAGKDSYEDSILPHGSLTGTPEEALDCACGLYLNDITAWTEARHDGPNSRDYLR